MKADPYAPRGQNVKGWLHPMGSVASNMMKVVTDTDPDFGFTGFVSPLQGAVYTSAAEVGS